MADDDRYASFPESQNIDDRRPEYDTQDVALSDDQRPVISKVVDYITAPPGPDAGKGISSEAGYYDIGNMGSWSPSGGDDSTMKGGFVGAYKAGGPVDPRAKRRQYPKKSPFKL